MDSTASNRARALTKKVGPGGPITAKSPISALHISTRAFNRLFLEGIETVGELTKKSEMELIILDGMGRASLREIKDALAQCGLRLR